LSEPEFMELWPLLVLSPTTYFLKKNLSVQFFKNGCSTFKVAKS